MPIDVTLLGLRLPGNVDDAASRLLRLDTPGLMGHLRDACIEAPENVERDVERKLRAHHYTGNMRRESAAQLGKRRRQTRSDQLDSRIRVRSGDDETQSTRIEGQGNDVCPESLGKFHRQSLPKSAQIVPQALQSRRGSVLAHGE